MYRIGVIGTGGIAGVHLHNLKSLPDVEISALCDISPNTLRSQQENYGGRIYQDYQEMFAKETLDGVLLCTPSTVRLDPIRYCVDNEIPIFIEKPPCGSVAEGQEILSIIEKRNALHFVGFVFRWLPLMNRLKELIQDRPLYSIRGHYLCDLMYPEARRRCTPTLFQKEHSGGMVGDQAIHIFDLVRYLSSSEVVKVAALGTNQLCPKSNTISTEETVGVTLLLENGVLVSHLHSWSYPRWDIGLHLFGEGFDLRINLSGLSLQGMVDGMEIHESNNIPLHLPEMEAFVRLIHTRDRSLNRCDFKDAFRSLCLTQLVQQSIDNQETLSFKDL
jgi:predicted dehydrogenase